MFQINVKNTEIEIFFSGKYVYFRNFIYIDFSWPSILDFNLNLFTMKARTSSPLTFYSKFVHTTLWFHNGYLCCLNILHLKRKDWKTTQLIHCNTICIQLSFFRWIQWLGKLYCPSYIWRLFWHWNNKQIIETNFKMLRVSRRQFANLESCNVYEGVLLWGPIYGGRTLRRINE